MLGLSPNVMEYSRMVRLEKETDFEKEEDGVRVVVVVVDKALAVLVEDVLRHGFGCSLSCCLVETIVLLTVNSLLLLRVDEDDNHCNVLWLLVRAGV